MAFVFRSKRDFKLSEIEDNNIYPGEYYQEPQLIKDIDKQSSEFQSKSPRNIMTKKFNTPGPGSYEKVSFNQDVFAKFNKYNKPKNIIETIKKSVIPTEIQDFLEKYQSVAFNSRAKRFNYKNEELEKERPGPGAYSPDIKYSPSKNKNNNSNINNNNNNNANINDSKSVISTDRNDLSLINIQPNYSSKNNSSLISSNNNNKSTDSTSANSKNVLNNKLIKINKSFNSEYRTETIPSKNNLGYDIDNNGDKKMIVVEKDKNQMDGTKRDSAGPGQYDIPISWEKNIINWKKTKDEKDEKYNSIKSRKNLSPLTQLEKDYLTNSQRETKTRTTTNTDSYSYKSKTKTEINYTPISNPSSRIFNFIMNFRYDKQRNIAEKRDDIDPIFEGTPGPGYYSPETQYEKSYNFSHNPNHCFYSNIPRFKTSTKINNDLGPGYYYNKTKPKKVEKPRYILGTNPNKENNMNALKLSLAKENYKVPGPGSYEIEGNLIKEDITKNQNFGANDIRFKKSFKIKEDLPGPGSYEIKSIFQKDNKELTSKNNIHKNYKNDLELIKELEKIPKETYSPPPVGLYNPNIISSMEYEIKSRVNPYLDEKKVGFGIQEKKGESFITQENNSNVGPGKYYKTKKLDNKQNKAPFNQNNKRFKYTESSNKYIPGPGAYDINSFEDWNKKSHNILFV